LPLNALLLAALPRWKSLSKPGKTLVVDLKSILTCQLSAELKNSLASGALEKKFLPPQGVFVCLLEVTGLIPPSAELRIVNIDPQILKLFREPLRKHVMGMRVFRQPPRQARQVLPEVALREGLESP
jgi:hypothetical protein